MIKEKRIVLPDHEIFYSISGNGFPLMLVHGLAEDHTVWNFIRPALEKHFTIITPDLSGWGKSTMAESFSSIEEFALDVNAVLTNENFSECVMIGHSMGGYVTLAFAKLFPEKLKAFGLFHSSAYADDAEKKLNRDKVAAFVLNYGTPPYINELYNTLFANSFYTSNSDVVAQLKNYAADFNGVTIQKSVIAMKHRPDTTSVLKNATVPVLFIIGEEDKAAPANKMFEQVSLPKIAVVEFITEAGHMGHIEQAALSSNLILKFLEIIDLNKAAG